MFYNTVDNNKDIFGISSDYSIVGGQLVKAEPEQASEDNEES